jgi:integrase/recombinase XerD
MQNNRLTENEIKSIADYRFTPGSVMDQHRDLFLFSYYVGGIRLSDILILKWDNFDGSNIHFYSRKSNTPSIIALSSQAIAILTKYSQNGKKDEYIFPILAGWIDVHVDANIKKRLSFLAKLINTNLSIIAKMAGIEKNISYHLSRHVFQPIY